MGFSPALPAVCPLLANSDYTAPAGCPAGDTVQVPLILSALLLAAVAVAPAVSAGPLTCVQPAHLVCDVVNPVYNGAMAAAAAAEAYALCVVNALLTNPIPTIPFAILAC